MLHSRRPVATGFLIADRAVGSFALDHQALAQTGSTNPLRPPLTFAPDLLALLPADPGLINQMFVGPLTLGVGLKLRLENEAKQFGSSCPIREARPASLGAGRVARRKPVRNLHLNPTRWVRHIDQKIISVHDESRHTIVRRSSLWDAMAAHRAKGATLNVNPEID